MHFPLCYSETHDERMVNSKKIERQYIKQTYPNYLNMSPQDMECKCNNRIRSKSSLLSLEGNSLNIETEGTERKQENTETNIRAAKKCQCTMLKDDGHIVS